MLFKRLLHITVQHKLLQPVYKFKFMAAVIQSKYLMPRSEHKAFLLMRFSLLHNSMSSVNSWKKYCEFVSMFIYMVHLLWIHKHFFSSVKMNNYSSQENNKVLQTSPPTPQKTNLTALRKGTSSSFFSCCTHNKIFSSPEQKCLKNIRGNLKHLAVWTKKKGQWQRIQIQAKNQTSQNTAFELQNWMQALFAHSVSQQHS